MIRESTLETGSSSPLASLPLLLHHDPYRHRCAVVLQGAFGKVPPGGSAGPGQGSHELRAELHDERRREHRKGLRAPVRHAL